ncbi:hypothetical protein [Pseudomonas qingdaonensis]|uniref:hypothetical protein n=1 Tax=Pseudomonas qingdaonensis TaxID=2056231 RepID=UPI001F171402|nr:hypothetical protein [Pseudomonas qingdaonensis]
MSDFPTAQEFCVSIPLYVFYPVTQENFEQFHSSFVCANSIDCFCVECGKESTFRIKDNYYAQGRTLFDNWADHYKYLSLMWRCSRDDEHQIIHTFMFNAERGVQKVGQFPSSYDVTVPGLKKYKKILGAERHAEMVKAVGLHAHGAGAGSLIYLRRIFEGLIEEAHTEALTFEEWVKAHGTDFDGLRVADKIKSLKRFLPKFLVDNQKIYGALSQGVHSMSEDECSKLFPVLRSAIELILNQKLSEMQQKKHEIEIAKHLNAIERAG